MTDPTTPKPTLQTTIAQNSTLADATIHVHNQVGDNHYAHPWQPSQADARRLLDAMPLTWVPPVSALPAGFRLPHAANPHFVGRDEVLLSLAAALHGGERVAIGPKAVAAGLGGIGKTSVAAEFAHRYGCYFAGGVFWLSFADPAAVPGEIAVCGGPGHLNLHPSFNQLKQDEQVQLVLTAWAQEMPRLLIFDTCEDPRLIQQHAPVSGGCRVLITSRREEWPRSFGLHTLSLDLLARSASVALLRQLAPRLTAAEAEQVAEELGDLPLALELAGSYLHQFSRTSVAAYLAELRSDVILAHPSLRGQHDDVSLTKHDRHVGRTFLVSYQRLDPAQADDALAIALLARAACLAPGEPIPRDLLLASADLTSEAAGGQAALDRLRDLGLLTMAAETVLLHRLVHAFVPAVAPGGNALAAVEQTLIHQTYEINQAGLPAAMQPLLAHLRWATRQALERVDEPIATLCNNLGFHFKAIGDYASAHPLYEQALAIREQTLGAIHPDTATSLNNLAELHRAIGDYGSARPLLERALEIREQTLGAIHPDTAQSLNNLAGLHADMDDYAAARPLYERALAIREQTLGDAHSHTAQSLNNLAELYRATGDYASARPLYERALAIDEAVYGSQHPVSATDLNNLAALHYTTGEYSSARPLFERALAICEQTLGATHPHTAASLNNLALLHQAMGDYASARPLHERALAIREQMRGATHPDIATSLNNLAGLHATTGDYASARPLYERALAICEQTLGTAHPTTVRFRKNLASLPASTIPPDNEIQRLEQKLAARERSLGSEHPDTASCMHELALLHLKHGNPTAAQPLLERALALRERIRGARHPQTQATRAELAKLRAANGAE